MTDTHTEPLSIDIPMPEIITPDPIEVLFQGHYLKVLFWTVSDTFWDDEETRTLELATLQVVYTNGKRHFLTERTFDLDTVYGLVGTGDITAETAQIATQALIKHGHAIHPSFLDGYEADEAWAKAVLSWQPSDVELLQNAANICDDPDLGLLLGGCADLLESLPRYFESLATPEAQLIATAVRIAWDLL